MKKEEAGGDMVKYLMLFSAMHHMSRHRVLEYTRGINPGVPGCDGSGV